MVLNTLRREISEDQTFGKKIQYLKVSDTKRSVLFATELFALENSWHFLETQCSQLLS